VSVSVEGFVQCRPHAAIKVEASSAANAIILHLKFVFIVSSFEK